MRPLLFISVPVVLAMIGFAACLHSAFMWSDRFLEPVHTGMTKSQVRDLVGAPPSIREKHGAETWDFTRAWSRDARVYFDTKGVVSAVETD
ncbi:MAG: outer membrane protein assembly factor BamE [Chthoniobacterales bacterium]|nr:outer membrane protein assembly factor BamE [Chthoniobacterales bacterium]